MLGGAHRLPPTGGQPGDSTCALLGRAGLREAGVKVPGPRLQVGAVQAALTALLAAQVVKRRSPSLAEACRGLGGMGRTPPRLLLGGGYVRSPWVPWLGVWGGHAWHGVLHHAWAVLAEGRACVGVAWGGERLAWGALGGPHVPLGVKVGAA